MRDPCGRVSIREKDVQRVLSEELAVDHYLNLDAARSLVASGDLISFIVSENRRTITSPRTAFVSYPYEWSDAQLADAAELTLHIAEIALQDKWELKDASAWNVVFNGSTPQFCDHLSFQPIVRQRWWAFGQFIRHFVLPLCVSKITGLRSADTFKIDRDGLSPARARSLAGFRIYLTRCWPLVAGANASERTAEPVPRDKPVQAASSFHSRLLATCRFMLRGWSSSLSSSWSGYKNSRDHYSSLAQGQKFEKISEWIKDKVPEWVVDFGCNTGEFSILCASHGARVVAIDLDHDCIEKLYLSQKGNSSIFPVLANLDDISAGRGWSSLEFPGLIERLNDVGEMVLMLALVHHLAISNSVPLIDIAEFAKRVTKKWLILEVLDERDPLIVLLCRQRDRSPSEFSMQCQMDAFEKYFFIEEKFSIVETGRQLLLLKPR